MRKFLFITYLFASLSLFASEITGVAPSYVGKKLVLSTSNDGWGATKEILDTCTVAEDGSFSLQVKNSETIQAQLDLGYYTGIIYVEKGKNYRKENIVRIPCGPDGSYRLGMGCTDGGECGYSGKLQGKDYLAE